MGRCLNHPERETSYKCMKHNYFLCEDCLECRDPDIYCKFRTSCPIHFISNKNFNAPDEKEYHKTDEEEICTVFF